ncbi:hypothetical protein LSM04_005796 [Trypanosoma melophagium]|nr:hypothetical protein LSM04_005796 [Trypanosoma melophagium]
MDLVSIMMLIISFIAFVLPPGNFITIIPVCWTVMAIGILLEFVAALNHRLRKPFFMFHANTLLAMLGILFLHAFLCALLVSVIALYRKNPIQNYYRTLQEKKAHIKSAFDRLKPRLMDLEVFFTDACNMNSGLV